MKNQNYICIHVYTKLFPVSSLIPAAPDAKLAPLRRALPRVLLYGGINVLNPSS